MLPNKKILTCACTLDFVNKGIKDINASKIFEGKNFINSLLFNL